MVGSGFGGSVIACRLAEQGRSVVVLERGRRWPPGSFARRPDEMGRNLWDPSAGLQGLFDLWSFRHTEAVVASGVGGGSLIYANVLLRKPERWFVRDAGPGGGYESWPVTRADLDPWYDLVEGMLGATPYPYDSPKTRAFERAAGRLGLDCWRPGLAVSFSGPGQPPGEPVPGENLHGVPRRTCRLCGECDVGCNDGAKSTLDLTYLSRAVDKDAVLRDRSEVRRLTPLPDGTYEVGFVHHAPDNEGVPLDTRLLPEHVVRCRTLVLGAGALGTTYLLLRNAHALPGLGPALGTRFCGNGDLLGFVHGTRERLKPSLGPVITATAASPDALDGGTGRGFFVQEGGYPGFVDWALETATVAGPVSRLARFAAARLVQTRTGVPRSEIAAQVSGLLGDGHLSAGVLPLLGMGRDVPDGRLSLRDGWLDVTWNDTTSFAYYARVQATMAAVARECAGEFTVNPTRTLHRLITVHPVGGVPMGADARRGVVDDHGEAFGHPGLFVVDGAALPGPVGANPSLTIAALAERSAGRIAERAA